MHSLEGFMEVLDLGPLMGKRGGTQMIRRENATCKSLEAWEVDRGICPQEWQALV